MGKKTNPKKCIECDKFFKDNNRLNNHLAKFHCVSSSVTMHKCDQCPKSYTSEQLLFTHSKKIHKVSKLHTCTFCLTNTNTSSNFETLHLLRQHIRLTHKKDMIVSNVAKAFYMHHF